MSQFKYYAKYGADNNKYNGMYFFEIIACHPDCRKARVYVKTFAGIVPQNAISRVRGKSGQAQPQYQRIHHRPDLKDLGMKK